MSWTPIVEIDFGNKSSSEQAKDFEGAEFRSSVISMLSSINQQICLLNERFEEAFETQIEETDT